MTAVPVRHFIDGRPQAPVVLLSNSLGSTIHMWDLVLPRLTERFRVVRYDLRGHGHSPVPPGPYDLDDLVDDAIGVLDRLDVERAHIVGLSLGGMVSLRLAVLHPERVDRLAVLCTSAQLGPASGWAERAATVRAHGTASIAASVVSRWITPVTAAADPALLASLEAMVAATPAEGYAGCCGAIERMDQRADLPKIGARTLAIAGADDPATPPEHLERIVAGIPEARLAVVANAAHVATVEKPNEITDLLLAHLTEAEMDDEARRRQGFRVRREVLGDVHVDRALRATTDLTAPFQDLITRYAWGDVWSRPGLDRRTRSILTLSLLCALGHDHELGMHVRAALTNGVSRDEIGEVLLHCAVYAGVPAANRALAIAQAVLAEIDAELGEAELGEAAASKEV